MGEKAKYENDYNLPFQRFLNIHFITRGVPKTKKTLIYLKWKSIIILILSCRLVTG
jgi:hypothetical protein